MGENACIRDLDVPKTRTTSCDERRSNLLRLSLGTKPGPTSQDPLPGTLVSPISSGWRSRRRSIRGY